MYGLHYLNFTCLFYIFAVATRNVETPWVAHRIYLLGSPGLELHQRLSVQNHLNLPRRTVPALRAVPHSRM